MMTESLNRRVKTLEQRLQVLCEQRAKFGELYTPPHIIIDMEQVSAELSRLRAELGKIQPNPVAGSPTASQALNRYHALPLGPPGVAEVLAASGGFDPFSSPLTANGGRNLVSAGIGQALNRAGAGAALETALIKLGSAPAVKRATALLDIAVNLGARPMPKGVTAIATSSAIKNFQSKLGKEIFTPSDLVGGGVGLVVDVGYQLWMDWDNPYLTTGQWLRRGAIAGVASGASFFIATPIGYYAGKTLGSFIPGAGTIVGIVAGVTIGVTLDLTVIPIVYWLFELNPQRNLAPLE